MIRVCENDLRFAVDEIPRVERFNRCLRADWHEDWRFDCAVGCGELRDAREAVGFFNCKRKLIHSGILPDFKQGPLYNCEMWNIDQFIYILPDRLIAQTPAVPRDHSRLMVVDRSSGRFEHRHFWDLPGLLSDGDVLVRNNTKVLPARIFGRKESGGRCEILLIKQVGFGAEGAIWECLTKPGLKESQVVAFEDSLLRAKCQKDTNYTRILEFNQKGETFFASLEKIGHVPIPPYIHWEKDDETELRKLYQTTFAKVSGSVAAPTAGLHFTPELDEALRKKGAEIEEVTLHVGLGTFLPLQKEQLVSGKLHSEFYILSADVAERLNRAKSAGKRIISVGTTTTRVLETCVGGDGLLSAQSGETDIFIQPGYKFAFVDSLMTNFHLPKSSLLMLISAFVSAPNTSEKFVDFQKSLMGRAYEEAIRENYRFYSFGDAMWVR